jgi:hypothetical protein
MLRPSSTYARIAAEPMENGAVVLLRGPLFVALAVACSISFLTRGYLAPGLITSEAFAWSFVPLAEIAGVAAVWRARRSNVSFAQAMDLFFAGHAPWLLWLVASVVFWRSGDTRSSAVFSAWVLSIVPIAAWSGYIDFQFFRQVTGMKNPGRYLVLQRVIGWTLFISVFGGVSLWPGLIEELGLR